MGDRPLAVGSRLAVGDDHHLRASVGALRLIVKSAHIYDTERAEMLGIVEARKA